jgi:hypothetical protein
MIDQWPNTISIIYVKWQGDAPVSQIAKLVSRCFYSIQTPITVGFANSYRSQTFIKRGSLKHQLSPFTCHLTFTWPVPPGPRYSDSHTTCSLRKSPAMFAFFAGLGHVMASMAMAQGNVGIHVIRFQRLKKKGDPSSHRILRTSECVGMCWWWYSSFCCL